MKCPDCPVPGPCVGERPGKAHACAAVAEFGDVGRRHVLSLSGQPQAPPSADSRPRPPVALVMSVQRRSKACPHYRPCATGCGGASCAMGDRPISPWRDCSECLYLPDEAPP